jgi:hypothetical protein
VNFVIVRGVNMSVATVAAAKRIAGSASGGRNRRTVLHLGKPALALSAR